MSTRETLIKSSIVLMIFSFVGQILGFIREMLIASKFGSNWETDAFFIALTATGLLTALVASSIRTTLIPILTEVETNEGKRGKVYHTNNYLNTFLIISILFVILGILIAPLIIKILAMGFHNDQFDLAVLLMRIGMIGLIFKVIVGVYRGYLHSEGKFFESAVSDISLNFITILFLLFLTSFYGIKGLMVASVLGILTQFLIQIPALKKVKYYYKATLNFKDKYIKKLLYLVPPVLIGVAINDINKIVDKTLASTLAEGSISALNYAAKLEGLILTVFITSIITVIFPQISKKVTENKVNELNKINKVGFNLILIITVPATMGAIVLATPIVEIAFQRGEFDIEATKMTAIALIFYTLGLIPNALRLHYNNIFYSIQDTKTPMINGGITVLLNLLLSLLLIKHMQHAGLALATSIASFIATILLGFALKKKIGVKVSINNLKVFLKSTVGSIIITILAYILYNTLIEKLGDNFVIKLVSLITSVGISGLLYVILLYILKVEEVKFLINTIKRN